MKACEAALKKLMSNFEGMMEDLNDSFTQSEEEKVNNDIS